MRQALVVAEKHEQALVAAIAALHADRQFPLQRRIPGVFGPRSPADVRPLLVQIPAELGVGLNPVAAVVGVATVVGIQLRHRDLGVGDHVVALLGIAVGIQRDDKAARDCGVGDVELDIRRCLHGAKRVAAQVPHARRRVGAAARHDQIPAVAFEVWLVGPGLEMRQQLVGLAVPDPRRLVVGLQPGEPHVVPILLEPRVSRDGEGKMAGVLHLHRRGVIADELAAVVDVQDALLPDEVGE